jgi:hypothetical protein
MQRSATAWSSCTARATAKGWSSVGGWARAESWCLIPRKKTPSTSWSIRCQHYRPGGGFKLPHFERSNYANTTRMLVWMTYLNDVTDGGGTHFLYQKHTFEAKKGRTLIWPPDFTHTHVGVVSPTQHKYIITGWMNYVPQP